MKYIIAIALMFAIATPVLANEADSDAVVSVSKATVSTSVSDTSGQSSDSTPADTNSNSGGGSGGGHRVSIQDKIFALTGYRFEKTNDPRMIEIYNTLYQILLALKTV